MSLNLERKLQAERRAEKEKARRVVTKDDIIIFKDVSDEQRWRLSQLMKDPVSGVVNLPC